jgi:hypothetical protein
MIRRPVMLTLSLCLLAACAAPTALPEPSTVEPPTASAGGGFAPMPLADCQALHAEVMAAVGHRFAGPIDVPYTDPVSNTSGTACNMEADGTGADFSSPAAVMGQIRGALTAGGWVEDPSHQADGPTGTSTAFTKGTGTVFASAAWEPSEDANCPPDQPIAACPLTPEQQLYQVQLWAVTTAP